MSISKHIPNAITCCNLLSGCISIMFITYYKNPVMAAVMIFAAAVFDFLDGFAARALHAKSPIGADLDSLSDVVSFGVAPSFIIAWYLKASGLHCNMMHFDIIPCLAFLIAVFAAIRLAKFNNDTRQASSFIGLPVPATGLFIASLPLMMSAIGSDNVLADVVLSPYFLLFSSAILCWLMISEVPFFSFKIKNISFKDNVLRYIVVIFALLSVAFFKIAALPFIFIFYILLSVIFYRGE